MARKKQKKEKDKQQAAVAEPKHITPVDIQQKEFRVAMRGYHEQDVDQFLDDVTEEVARLYAENKRLREELEFVGTRRPDVGASGEGEAILLRARDEADRILAEARARVAAADSAPAGSSSPRSPAELGPFIAREREFLQGLADLIQSHAEAVKEDLRRARRGAGGRPPQAVSLMTDPGHDTPTQAWAMGQEARDPEPSGGAPSEPGRRFDLSGTSLEDRAAVPSIQGQDWTQYYAGPTVSTRPADQMDAASDDRVDDIVDLTRAPGAGGSFPQVTHGTERTSGRGSDPTDEDDPGDRSLRELFWGED